VRPVRSPGASVAAASRAVCAEAWKWPRILSC